VQPEYSEHFIALTIFSRISGILLALFRMIMDPTIKKEFKKFKKITYKIICCNNKKN
jgi:hypothetical protein